MTRDKASAPVCSTPPVDCIPHLRMHYSLCVVTAGNKQPLGAAAEMLIWVAYLVNYISITSACRRHPRRSQNSRGLYSTHKEYAKFWTPKMFGLDRLCTQGCRGLIVTFATKSRKDKKLRALIVTNYQKKLSRVLNVAKVARNFSRQLVRVTFNTRDI